jgi:Zn ribbon nucleic-acid-binding protein
MQKQTTRLARLIGRALKKRGITCPHTTALEVAAQIGGLKNVQTLQAKLKGNTKGKPRFQTVPDEAIRHIWKDRETGEEIQVGPDYYEVNGEPNCEESDEVCEYLRTEVLLPHDPTQEAKDPLASWIQKAVASHKGKEKCKPTKAHLFQVLVLTERDDQYNPESLETLAYDINKGDHIGDWKKCGEQNLSALETQAVLLDIGNDGSFFEPEEEDDENTDSIKGIELSDGGIIEPPEPDSGAIRRRDVHGNTEEVLRPGDESYEEYKALFEEAERDEVMAEGRYVRVCLLDIGEGIQGDYNEKDPNDIPLLRMDVSRRGKHGGQDVDDNEWGLVRNGSFCTNISARTPARDQKEICRHLAKELSKMSPKQSMGHIEILSHLEGKQQALDTRVLPNGIIELGRFKTTAEQPSDKGKQADKNPLCPAEIITCPECKEEDSFNREDMGSGFDCLHCGHHFTEAEEQAAKENQPQEDEVTEIAKARMAVNKKREVLLQKLRELLPEKDSEINFLETLNESLCTSSANGINHAIHGIRHDKEGFLVAFGNEEDDSCGVPIGEINENLADMDTDSLVSIAELAERARKT